MNKLVKLLVLAVTLLPLIDMLIFVGRFFVWMLTGRVGEFEITQSTFGTFFFIGWLVVMTTFYVTHAVKSRLRKNWKTFWVVLIVLFNMYSMPIYWYLNLWRKGDGQSPA